MSGKSNEKRGDRIHARGGGGSSSKRPGTNSEGNGRRKKTKQSDNTTSTGRNTRNNSHVDDDDDDSVATIPKNLRAHNKPSGKGKKDVLNKSGRKERHQRSNTTTGTGTTGGTTANNNGSNKRRESSKYKDDSEYSKTSSEEEEEEEEAWENDNTTKKKKKKKTTTKKKATAVVTEQQRIQFRQLDRPISIMVAWDKPKRSNSPPQWPKAVSNYVVIRKTNMTTASVSLSGIINLIQDYLPSHYEFGSIQDMTVYYDDVNDSIVPSASASSSNYDKTRSDSTSGVSSDGQFVDAIINKSVTYDVANTRIPCDDDDDDDDDEDDETYHHIDLLIRLKSVGVTTTSTAPRRGRAAATVTIPDKVEITVCDLVVQRAPRDGDDEDDEIFIPESSKTFGTVVYSYQEFGTTKSVGNVVYALWQVYDTDTRGNIGQRSPLYLKTNRVGRGKMTQIRTSVQLSEALDILLKKTYKQLVVEREGDAVFCIELSLGLRGATAVAMQQSVIADQLQQATFTQESYDPPANEEDRGGGTRRGRRCASRSLGASALSMFKKYYLDDNNDNPYHHSLSHEHRSVFLTRYENDSSERRQLLEQLNDGEYPSLDWMCNNPLIDASIPPGAKKWKPIDHHGTPPYALPRSRPSAWKDDMTGVLNGFVERLEDTPPAPPPQATVVNFFRHDLVNNERYEIPVPPKYISRACEEENGGAGKDLIFQAHYLARNYTRVPLFTANLQQYKDQLNDDTMKIYYRFNDCKYPSKMFLRMSIADILKGNTTNTVQIEMIVEEVGTQLNDEDGLFF